MLLKLDDTNKKDLKKLMEYAREHNIQLSVVEEDVGVYGLAEHPTRKANIQYDQSSPGLPGNALSSVELENMIEEGRKEPKISMTDAHTIIRKKLYGD